MADFYGAIKDAAVNRLISAMMAFRPSLFNYAAPSWKPVDPNRWFAGTKEVFLSCYQVGLASAADPNTTPRFTRLPYLPAPALGGPVAPLQLPWCFQVSSLAVDFHPTDQIATLPPELSPPLTPQHFALEMDAFLGIGCPSPDLVQSMLGQYQDFTRRNPVIPVDRLQCFQLQLYITAHLEKTAINTPPIDAVAVKLDDLEIVDLQPDGLENALECYLRTLVTVVLAPQLIAPLQTIVVEALGVKVSITPTLAPDVPVNPAIEENELRIWVNVKIA